MEQRVYHGPIHPPSFAQALVAEFDRTNYRVQQLGELDHLVVQIARPDISISGGHTSITVHLIENEDGVLVRLGQQAWLGVAASLGFTALTALRNPFSLLGRLDDLAQDISSLQLTERIWDTMDTTAASMGASLELSEALRRLACPYCDTSNQVGVPSCVACGAPLGKSQPIACPRCGFVSTAEVQICAQCGQDLAEITGPDK
ncbi:MAG: zinc ribbon domain-containing protein [Anaerolineales bacterium]